MNNIQNYGMANYQNVTFGKNTEKITKSYIEELMTGIDRRSSSKQSLYKQIKLLLNNAIRQKRLDKGAYGLTEYERNLAAQYQSPMQTINKIV